eukprot:TRINITY_DN16995_c0_g1_i2.p1 TRINITY_DN16995_c0_g1~~TRINITY_DN16995_c0_g1_i2.p1  ORF type:complete len:213 (-),score=26.82 TRINITY_DN16995_c0_g1_i2:86-724(-)
MCQESKGEGTSQREGDLILGQGKVLSLVALLNNRPEGILFHVDSGTPYSQIDSHLARCVGLKGHPRLLGISTLANGRQKYDYLCKASVTILGVRCSVVVRVAPDQPALLGLDVMYLLSMSLNIPRGKFQIAGCPASRGLFRFIDVDAFLQGEGIDEEQLVPVEGLPPPDQSYQQLVRMGKGHVAFNLGMYFGDTEKIHNGTVHKILDLGTSF